MSHETETLALCAAWFLSGLLSGLVLAGVTP
jgi:hypothetical protein